jgi:hypothetical protein
MMNDINLPYYIENARDLPPLDTTAAKESLIHLVDQLQKQLPPMFVRELPLWCERYEKIETGRWKYLVACHKQAQDLANWHQFRQDNPEAAALPISRDALEFGLSLGIEPSEWPVITQQNLLERLTAFLLDARSDAFLASFDVLYLRAIAPTTLSGDSPDIRFTLDAMIERLSQSLDAK